MSRLARCTSLLARSRTRLSLNQLNMTPTLGHSSAVKAASAATGKLRYSTSSHLKLTGLADLSDTSGTFSDIFGTPEMRTIWSDQNRVSCYLQIEAALAQVQAELDIIPHRAATEIISHCRVEEIDFALYKQKTELIGYPILGIVQQLVANCKDGLGEYCHWGATTQDITDTATVMQIRQSMTIVKEKLHSIISSLERLAEEHRDLPMAGRSNLKQAVPITFGFKMARFLATFRRHQERLAELERRVYTLEFGGAAGNLSSLGDKGIATHDALATALDLRPAEIAWHTEHDRFAEVGTFLGLLTGTLAKLATDIKLMSQTEIAEVAEPYLANRGSSSTMPQKNNPISCVYIHACAANVRASTSAMLDAMQSDHERGTGPWEIIWVQLPLMMNWSSAALSNADFILKDLQVFGDAMQRNLDISKGLVVSEAVMMGLGDKMGRQYAHDVVYECCRKAFMEDRPLVDALMENEEIASKTSRDELEKLCDPKNYLGQSGQWIDRVLSKSSSHESQ
ncbi:putative Adenylosuccinate lyase (putative) [Pseudozyma hubeiensis]|nr:putative Adenylosuccinate lyase (putative) [Pseudozyma hubeiensis]